MLVNQGTYEECQGKSDEFVEGFNRAIEMFRAELSRLGD
jgi:hypothetical protein